MSSEAGRWLGLCPQSSSPDHSRSEKPVPPRGAERPGTQERTTKSTFYCRELVCCHVQRPQQHEGCGFSFYFISTFPFLWVSLSSVRSRCFLPPAVPGHGGLRGGIAQTESLRSFAGPWVGAQAPSRVEMHRRTEIALGPLLLLCGQKSSWLYSGIARTMWTTCHRW